MLTKTSIESSLPLARLSDSKNLVIKPVASSQLEALLVATYGQTLEELKDTMVDGGFGYNADVTIQRTNSPVPGSDVVLHNQVMDQLIPVGVEQVCRQIQFAKTTAWVAIKEIVKNTREALLQRDADLAASYVIRQRHLPDPLVDAGFGDVLSKYAAGAFSHANTNLKPRWPLVSMEELIKHTNIGVARLNADINTWLQHLPETFVISVWSAFFSLEKTPNQSTASVGEMIRRPKDYGIAGHWHDVALLVYLWSVSLESEPLPDSGMGIDELGTILRLYQDIAGTALIAAFDDVQRILKSGKVIESLEDRTANVIDQTYQEWLEQDGANCSECILGLLVRNSEARTIDEINALRDASMAGWAQHLKLLESLRESQNQQAIRQILSAQFENYFRVLLKDNPEASGEVAKSREVFDNLILTYSMNELKDLWGPVIRSVCAAAFPRSGAEEILLSMDDLNSEQPDTNAGERLSMTIVRLVGRWLACQLAVTR